MKTEFTGYVGKRDNHEYLLKNLTKHAKTFVTEKKFDDVDKKVRVTIEVTQME
jgi:hypothetical protein